MSDGKTSEDNKIKFVRGVPLDDRAYLDAEKLFRETGDIRYAAIAVGKAAKAKVSRGGGIPEWAFEACQRYAEFVHRTPNVERRKARDGQTPPAIAVYEKIIHQLVKANKSGEHITFTEACKRCNCEDTDTQKRYRRWFKDELIHPRSDRNDKSPLGSVDLIRTRRVNESEIEFFKKFASKWRVKG